MILAFCILFTLLQGCGETHTKVETYEQYRTQQIETKDSLFVLYIIKEWGQQNWWKWGVREDLYHITQKDIKYFIGGVFYSSDKTKMLVWIGENKPNAKSIDAYNEEREELNRICPTAGDTIYSMSAVIGFRDRQNQKWQIYPFENQQAICCKSKAQAINILGQYYFSQMAEHSEYVSKSTLDENYGGKVRYDLEAKQRDLGYSETESILKNYGYNLQEEGFWEKSLIWQKGAKLKGYYNFQLYNDKPWDIPEIDYPKEILELYK